MNSSPPRRPAASVTRIERRSRSPSAASTSSPTVCDRGPSLTCLNPSRSRNTYAAPSIPRRPRSAASATRVANARAVRRPVSSSRSRSASAAFVRHSARTSAAHRAGAHQPTATQVTTNTQPRTVSARSVPRNERSNTWSVSRSVSPSRRTTTPAASAVCTKVSTSVPTTAPSSEMARPPGSSSADAAATAAWAARPPRIAARARPAWLASMPYHGASRSSRRSNEAMNATQPPAIGPPRTIAATMNGRWNVRTPWPDGPRTTLSEPASPNTVQAAIPAIPSHGASRPGSAIAAGSVPNSVTRTSAPRPATIVIAVYSGRSAARRSTAMSGASGSGPRPATLRRIRGSSRGRSPTHARTLARRWTWSGKGWNACTHRDTVGRPAAQRLVRTSVEFRGAARHRVVREGPSRAPPKVPARPPRTTPDHTGSQGPIP